MPEIGKCDLIATKIGEPSRYEPTIQDHVFKGHAFNFVVVIADGQTYEWISARGQAIKDNLIAQEEFLLQLFKKNTDYLLEEIFNSPDIREANPVVSYGVHGIKGLPPEKLLDPQVLAMPTKRSHLDLIWKDEDGNHQSPLHVIVEHPSTV